MEEILYHLGCWDMFKPCQKRDTLPIKSLARFLPWCTSAAKAIEAEQEKEARTYLLNSGAKKLISGFMSEAIQLDTAFVIKGHGFSLAARN